MGRDRLLPLRLIVRRTRASLQLFREHWRGARAQRHHADLPPRLVMTLLARNEADIVAATIEHAMASGVDFILATDNGSTDGTTEIFEAYRDAGVLELHHEKPGVFRQGQWVTAMAQRAAAVHGANWVLNADADEFVWCEGGLKPVLAGIKPRYGKVGLSMQTFFPAAEETGKWPQIAIYRAANESHDARGVTGRKLIHRADPHVAIDEGNHGAAGPLVGAMSPEPTLTLLHYPHRGYAHYERKIAQGGASIEANADLSADVALHWRGPYALYREGRLEADYRARHPDAARCAAMVASGEWVIDRRLPERLEALVGRAVRPDLLRAVLG